MKFLNTELFVCQVPRSDRAYFMILDKSSKRMRQQTDETRERECGTKTTCKISPGH